MKKLLLMIICMLVGLTLVSCGGQQTPPDNNNGGDEKEDKPAVEYSAIIKGDVNLDLTDISTKLTTSSDKMIYVKTSEAEAVDGEIVFGDTNRRVTLEAKAALDEVIGGVSSIYDDVAGYIIYKDQAGNIAVYWSDEFFLEDALKYFYDNYANVALLKSLIPGSIVSEAASIEERIYETAWAKVEEVASEDVVNALKRLNKYLDGSAIIDWMANLWEPYICVCGKCADEGKEIACYGGAFYYANSARDYESFLPDVESTRQALGRLVNSGAFVKYGNSLAKALPETIKQKIIVFCQELQDKESGYFYHPQWGSNIGAARRGRDLGHATQLLTDLGSKPKYPTALENLESTEDASAILGYSTNKENGTLTYPLGKSAASAVSAVIATGEFEDSLRSEAAYLAWLYKTTAGIKVNTEGAHTLASVRSQIKAAGYLEITMDYLDQKLRENYDEMKAAYDADPESNPEPTGLWQKEINYSAVWGLLKLYGFYNATGRALPYPVEAMRTCVAAIMIDADEGGNYHMNDVYNMWGAPNNILANAKKHYPELLDELYAIAAENAAGLVDETIAKLAKFRQDDGSYSYCMGYSSPTTQGVTVSLGFAEGDVNATALAMDTYQRVFSVLGLSSVEVKICDYRDGDRFIETISYLTSATKLPLASDEPSNFDSNPVNMSVSMKSNGGSAELISDPADSSNSVLAITTKPGSGDSVLFKVNNPPADATKFIFEADIRLEEVGSYAYLFQVNFGTAYMMDIRNENGQLRISDNATASSANKYVGDWKVLRPIKTWVHIKIEYIIDPVLPTINVYADGELFATGHNYYDSHLENPKPTNEIGEIKFWGMKNADGTVLLDNLYLGFKTGTAE